MALRWISYILFFFFNDTATTEIYTSLFVGSVIFDVDSKWMLARTTDTTLPEGFLFVARVIDLGKADVPWKKISDYSDKITQVALKGDDLYLMTYTNAPRHHVLKLNLNQPQLALARVVATPPKDAVLEHFSLSRDALVASIREGTSVGVRRYAPGDTLGQPIALPFPGAAGVHADPAHAYKNILYSLSGWTQLPRTFVFDGKRSRDSGLRANVAAPAVPEIEITELRRRVMTAR